jgi:hypothetical protein
MYYLVLRPGTGESPSNVDGVLLMQVLICKKGTVADATELTLHLRKLNIHNKY